MEKIEIKAKDLYLEHMVDAMTDYIKEKGCPELDEQEVRFVNNQGAFWDHWYVSENKRDCIRMPFLALVGRGIHETSPKGVAYRSMSRRDATFKVGEKVYFMSV